MTPEQNKVYQAFKKLSAGNNKAVLKHFGYGGSLGDEYLRGVNNHRPLSAPDSIAWAAWKAGQDYDGETSNTTPGSVGFQGNC